MKEAEGNWEASRKSSELGSMKEEGWTMFRSGSMKTARHAELAAGEGCFFFFEDTEHDTRASDCLCSAFPIHASNPKTVCTHLKLLGAQGEHSPVWSFRFLLWLATH